MSAISPILTRARRARLAWSHLGPRWLAYRVGYMAQQRLGLLRRRTPSRPWADRPLAAALADQSLAEPAAYLAYRREAGPAFLFDPARLPGEAADFAGWDAAGEPPAVAAEAFAAGRLRYFSGGEREVGAPPDWLRSPLSGARVEADRHWSQVREFGHGDIKQIWEASRFGFTYELARAYARSRDERYAELFWAAVESWRAANPAFLGPNWKCGQETSLRAMAWCFGLYAFLHARATTAERVAALAELMAASGQRVAANLSYALSQRNNHGISEGMGLFTIGTLFPELRGAPAWEARGRQVLERLARELIDDDGGFAQHSANYERLAIHDYLWAARIAGAGGRPLSDELRGRVLRSAGLLYQMQDAQSGRLPVYGQNDGALVLRLSPCPYDDYRPLIQAAHAMLGGARCYPPGPWDEEALWLVGPSALGLPLRPPERRDLAAPAAGCHTLRAPSGLVFTHSGDFRDRPGHADLLHVDLWWRGLNVAVDAGTYSYNAPVDWDSTFGETSCHNTVTVDGRSQMDRAGRFLWLPWAHSRATQAARSARGLLAVWEGQHDGYARLADPVAHRRAIVQIADAAWLVVDRLVGAAPHGFTLHWHFPDWPHVWDGAGALELATPAGAYGVRWAGLGVDTDAELLRGADGNRGWRSTRYGSREPALALGVTAQAPAAGFVTLLGAGPTRLQVAGDALRAEGQGWQALVMLRPADEPGPIVRAIVLSGESEDMLQVNQ